MGSRLMPLGRSALQLVLKGRCKGGEEVADCFQTSFHVCVCGNQRVTSKLIHLLVVLGHYRRYIEDLF